MPTDIPWIAYAFPFTANISKTGRDIHTTLMNLLPRTSMAQRFCDIYYRHAAWMYTPINESDFYENIFRPIYDPDATSYESISPHNLSVRHHYLTVQIESPTSVFARSFTWSLPWGHSWIWIGPLIHPRQVVFSVVLGILPRYTGNGILSIRKGGSRYRLSPGRTFNSWDTSTGVLLFLCSRTPADW